MNALVASVIRTYVPVIVGQVASWLLLAHIVLPAPALVGLTAFVGGLLTAIYYGGVRILEQQWPSFGILLGLTASPDTYSKDTPAGTAATPSAPAVTHVYNVAPASDPSIPAAAPATSFADTQAKIDAVQPLQAQLIDVPAAAAATAPADVPAAPAQ